MERYAWTQARALLLCGYEPHIFCPSERTSESARHGVTLHCVACRIGPFRELMVPVHATLVAHAVNDFLRQREGPFVIHSLGGWSYISALICDSQRKHGAKAIHVATSFDTMANSGRAKLRGVTRAHGWCSWLQHVVEYGWIRLLSARLEGKGYRRAEQVFVNYEAVRNLLERTYGLRNIRKLPYASETAFAPETTGIPAEVLETIASLQPAEAPLIVSVSRHSARKGVDVLIHALALLQKRGVPFRACLVGKGAGSLIEKHRALLRTLDLQESVAMPGFVPDSFAYLRAADVFVLPSLGEGSGSLSLVEALQAKVAVVASKIDGIPEDVVDGESALLVRPGHPAELSEALGRVLTDTVLRQRLALRGREVFCEKFQPEDFARALQTEYRELGFK